MKLPPKELGIKRALEMMAKPGAFLMKMHTNDSPNGRVFYVVPGGYVNPGDAEKILRRNDVQPCNNGLFPNCDQSWKLTVNV